MTVKWFLETGFAGCTYEDTIEIDDDATDKEIEEAVMEASLGYIEIGWEKVGDT